MAKTSRNARTKADAETASKPQADSLSIVTYVDVSTDDVVDYLGGKGDEYLSGGEKRSLFQRVTGIVPRAANIAPETLQTNLNNFLKAMEKSLNQAPVKIAHYSLEEIEVAVEVSAEGEVSLLGNGGKVGGKGTLTLKLKHDPKSS